MELLIESLTEKSNKSYLSLRFAETLSHWPTALHTHAVTLRSFVKPGYYV